jgi:hypothetical protein
VEIRRLLDAGYKLTECIYDLTPLQKEFLFIGADGVDPEEVRRQEMVEFVKRKYGKKS